MQHNERTYRQLHPRARARFSRLRDVLMVALMAVLALLFFWLVMALVFVFNVGPHL